MVKGPMATNHYRGTMKTITTSNGVIGLATIVTHKFGFVIVVLVWFHHWLPRTTMITTLRCQGKVVN
ncbi:hypothetical protein AAZX31_09G111300 [Glycine max]